MDELRVLAYYIYNIIFIITFDYDKYYNDLLKNALKYGMSRNDFWMGSDYKEYFLYEEAYYERMHENSHIQGYYNFMALNISLANMFKKEGDKALEYPERNIYTLSMEKAKEGYKTNPQRVTKITKENKNRVFRSRLAECY